MTMLIFVDESGDPGKTPGPSCSKFFTVTLVIFQDHEEALRVEESMKKLRQTLHLAENFEFHFSKLKHEWRENFLNAVGRHKWVYVTASINKAKLFGPGFEVPDSFYKFTCNLAFQKLGSDLRNAIVVIDSSGNRAFREELSAYLRKRLGKIDEDGVPAIKKLKMEDSHRNNLLQLADMVCGAISRDLNFPTEQKRFLRLVAANQMHRIIWPK